MKITPIVAVVGCAASAYTWFGLWAVGAVVLAVAVLAAAFRRQIVRRVGG